MKIITKIHGNEVLVKKLEEKGVTAKLTKGGVVVVDLPVDSVIGGVKYFKIIPEVLFDRAEQNENFFIQLSGGTMTGEYSVVVCDYVGRILEPFFVPKPEKGGYRSEGVFSARALTTVRVLHTSKGEKISIKKHVIVPINGQYLFISEREIYRGKIATLPKDLSNFLPAIQRAEKNINLMVRNTSKNILCRYEV